jgi:hypothetical protein
MPMIFRTRSLVAGLFLLLPAIHAWSAPGPLRIQGAAVNVGGTLFVSPATRFELAAEDVDGAALVRPVIDGREEETWLPSWSAGEHTAGAIVVDRSGERVSLSPLAFVVDALPPVFETDAGTLEDVSERMVEPRRESKRTVRARKKAPVRKGDLLWSSGWEDRWESLAEPVEIRSDRPQLFFRAPEGKAFQGGEEQPAGEALFVTAGDGDGGAGLEILRFRTREVPEGKVLEVEAVDLLGNVARREWRVVNSRR